MTADRIKEIQSKTAFPDSVSVYQALLQVWNECAKDVEYWQSESDHWYQQAIDMDGDNFMCKVHIGGIREDNGMDDCGNSDDEETMYCIIRLDVEGDIDEDDM